MYTMHPRDTGKLRQLTPPSKPTFSLNDTVDTVLNIVTLTSMATGAGPVFILSKHGVKGLIKYVTGKGMRYLSQTQNYNTALRFTFEVANKSLARAISASHAASKLSHQLQSDIIASPAINPTAYTPQSHISYSFDDGTTISLPSTVPIFDPILEDPNPEHAAASSPTENNYEQPNNTPPSINESDVDYFGPDYEPPVPVYDYVEPPEKPIVA